MKRFILMLTMAFLLVSCGGSPEKSVTKFLENIQQKKTEEAAKYTTNSEYAKNLGLEYTSSMQQLFFETLFNNMKFEVIGTEKVDDKTSLVTVNIENVDVEKVFLTIYQKLFQEAFSSNNTRIDIGDEFSNILKSPNVPKAINQTKFAVLKTKKGYKVDVSAENIDIMFGKFNSTFANLDKLGEHETTEKKELPKEGPSAGQTQRLDENKILQKK